MHRLIKKVVFNFVFSDLISLSIILGLLLECHLAFGLPNTLNYGGRLTDEKGVPVSGPIDIKVKFYRSFSGTDEIPVNVPQFSSIELQQGVFSLSINLTSIDLNQIFTEDDPVFIEITDETNNITYPRQQFLSVPYAFKVPVDGETVVFNADGKLTIAETEVAGNAIVDSINASNQTLDKNRLPNASGDVTGDLENLQVIRLQGTDLAITNPQTNEYLMWDGSKWVASGIAGANGGTVTQVQTGEGLMGGTITTSGTISLSVGSLTQTVSADQSDMILIFDADTGQHKKIS